MNRRKQTIRILGMYALIMSSTIFHANAQTDNSEGNRALLIEQIEKDHARLELSEPQKEPYTEITLRYADELKTLKRSSGSRMKKIKKVKSLKQSKDEEMRNLLSKKQYDAYVVIQKERWEKAKKYRNG